MKQPLHFKPSIPDFDIIWSMRYEFLNKQGHKLAGRLEFPDGIPRAVAVFAHCFTCSKDIIAASTISSELTRHGILVLRFDFTGLGNSDGDFANTDFSSNVEDLLSACESLREEYGYPSLLIGHSLGGAAVLKAAQLAEFEAVVTIGAPSDVGHVTHVFEEHVPKILEKGVAPVELAGRRFHISRQFVEDVREADILEGLAAMKAALLVLHSPTDQTVSVDHAAKIYQAARHPKSFVSLHEADHLLMNREDASYVANVIGAWVERYLKVAPISESAGKHPKKGILVVSRESKPFTHDVLSPSHASVADEPVDFGGEDAGMNPYEYLLSALGACTSMTIKMYARRKGIPLERVEVGLEHERVTTHSGDKVERIVKRIHLQGNLSEAQKTRMLEIAEKCPVNRTLLSTLDIRGELV